MRQIDPMRQLPAQHPALLANAAPGYHFEAACPFAGGLRQGVFEAVKRMGCGIAMQIEPLIRPKPPAQKLLPRRAIQPGRRRADGQRSEPWCRARRAVEACHRQRRRNVRQRRRLGWLLDGPAGQGPQPRGIGQPPSASRRARAIAR
jgi:hypothetical protein